MTPAFFSAKLPNASRPLTRDQSFLKLPRLAMM